ncbi:MAG: DUF1207 domain-containing protein [Gemmatimonadaceae bacterium]|nr:DUF1207 domain-containing protein [Gemmatimonadaceae bacterium]
MRRIGVVLAGLLAWVATAQKASGQSLPSTACGVGIPTAESSGYVGLPQGDVFCPLVADPKAVRSFASYLRGRATKLNPTTQSTFDTDVGAVGISDALGLGRWNGARPNDGVQFALSAGVFAQFDLGSSSYDLLNADYVVGLPITFRHGAVSGRARIYHQSSHLGDEFLLRPDDPSPSRENLSFEAVELLLSLDMGALRVYGGGESLINRSPADLERHVLHAGGELRPATVLFSLGSIASIRPIAAIDVKATSGNVDRPAMSATAGIDIARRVELDRSGRRWMILAQYYSGPSPYGQFYRDDIRYYGLGVSFNP